MVVNFSDKGLVHFLLRPPLDRTSALSNIRCLPLDHFYSSLNTPSLGRVREGITDNLNERTQLTHKPSFNKSVFTSNRFEPLSTLDQQD
mgnify:CR=1 FL=1